MSEQVLGSADVVTAGGHMVVIEHYMQLSTNQYRAALRISDISQVQLLRTLYSSVVVQLVRCEIRQDTLCGDDETDIKANGHIYVAIIPSAKNTDSLTGSSSTVVSMVRNKQTFPLSTVAQENRVYDLRVDNYENDVACDPRRGAAPCLWLGNSGVRTVGGSALPICSATFQITVVCGGTSVLW